MAFTEANLVPMLDTTGQGRTITLESFIPGPVWTDVYAVGVIAPYAGRSRWIQISSTLTQTTAAAAIVAGLL